MTSYRITRSIASMFLATGLVCGIGALAQEEQTPSNFVIVMLDRSRSFEGRAQSAIEGSQKYIDLVNNQKRGRWQGKADHVEIISLDAMPARIWQGNLQALKEMRPEDWTKRFAARSDFSKCTDVTGAFKLAGEEFASVKATSTNRYILAYSDFISEPPTTGVSTCAKPSYGPSDDFPWESLAGVSVTGLWLPPDQAYKWQKAFYEHGIKANLYSSSESEAVALTPPEAAKVTISKGEREKEAARYKSYLYGALKTIGAAATLILIYFLFASMSARRRGRTAHGSAPPRPQILTPAQLRARNATQPLRRN